MTGISNIQAAAGALDAQNDKLLQHAKIGRAGKDFESILLGNWLQSAEESFAKVPGGDGEDDDSGSGQFQGIAMQALAGSLTASGGIGIAKMITRSLQDHTQPQPIGTAKDG